jgi:hypothetical protein
VKIKFNLKHVVHFISNNASRGMFVQLDVRCRLCGDENATRDARRLLSSAIVNE